MIETINDLFPQPLDTNAIPRAFVTALLLECLLIGGVVWLLVTLKQTLPVDAKAPMHVSLVTLPAQPNPSENPPTPPMPSKVPLPSAPSKSHSPELPKPHPRTAISKPVQRHRMLPFNEPVSKPAASAPLREMSPIPEMKKVPGTENANSSQPTVICADKMAMFEGRVNSAVQSALHYPPAARMLHRQGQVRVAFNYQDGVVSKIHLLVASGFHLLDQAAMTTVQSAAYPMPPADLRGHLLHMTVWVQFREVNDD